MGRIVNSTYISVDGVVENPHLWPSLGRRPDDGTAMQIQTDLLDASDAVLMGRRTYESFAAVWPTRSDPYSDRINAVPKHVVSTTLTDPEWNNTHVIGDDVLGALQALKAGPDNVVQYGIGPVTRLLLEHGLLDEVRLWVHPLLVGGQATTDDLLFRPGAALGLDLVEARPLASGIVVLTYAIT